MKVTLNTMKMKIANRKKCVLQRKPLISNGVERYRPSSGPMRFLSEAQALERTKLVVLKHGFLELAEDKIGVVVSTPSLLENMARAVKAWDGYPPGEADGTYKLLYKGCVLSMPPQAQVPSSSH